MTTEFCPRNRKHTHTYAHLKKKKDNSCKALNTPKLVYYEYLPV